MTRTLALLLSLAPSALLAADLEMIVDRKADSVEIFFSLAAGDLDAVFDTDPAGLAADDGRIYFGALRETGTFDFGDLMVADARLTLGGTAQPLEAMSVMVHPDSDLPYRDPVDGWVAMSVCGVPDPVEPPKPQDLHLYAGFIAYPGQGMAAFDLTLPHQVTLDLTVKEFHEGDLLSEAAYTLTPGQPITLDPAKKPGHWLTRLFNF